MNLKEKKTDSGDSKRLNGKNREKSEIIADKTIQDPKPQNLPKAKQYQRNNSKRSKK